MLRAAPALSLSLSLSPPLPLSLFLSLSLLPLIRTRAHPSGEPTFVFPRISRNVPTQAVKVRMADSAEWGVGGRPRELAGARGARRAIRGIRCPP